jgi:hypothetical protein
MGSRFSRFDPSPDFLVGNFEQGSSKQSSWQLAQILNARLAVRWLKKVPQNFLDKRVISS